MNKKNALDVAEVVASRTEIKKTINISSLLISTAILLAAVLLLFFSTTVEDQSSALYMGPLTLGVLLVAFAVFRIMFKNKKLTYVGTGSKVLSGSKFIDMTDVNRARNAFATADFKVMKEIEMKERANARIDYLKSEDGEFMAVQLFLYVPYTFEAVSEVYYFAENKAKELAQYF